MRRLKVVPPAPARATEDLGRDEAIDYLRRMTKAAMDLCDAIDRVLLPEQAARRPQLRVIPGGTDNHDQDQDVKSP